MDKEAAAALAAGDHWFRHWMPWKFVKISTGEEHIYLPVNRALKPLGVTAQGCVRWQDYAAQAVVFRSDPHSFEGVWIDRIGSMPGLFLYDDTPESRMDYFVRFERLMTRASRLNGIPGV